MSRWLVNVRGQQFSAQDMGELRKLAKDGRLSAGDIVQPPGAAEWIYALEVPELKGSLRADLEAEFAPPPTATEMNPVVKWGLAALLACIAIVSWVWALQVSSHMPEPEDLELIGKKGLSYSEVLVTADPAVVHAGDSAGTQKIGELPKSSKADLLAKRGDWYRVRVNGSEGYVKKEDVIPAWFFADAGTQEKYKPLYYPDQYVHIQNSGWSNIPGSKDESLTQFLFMVSNTSMFPMTALKIKAAIKDPSGKLLEEVEIGVEGVLPAHDSNFVGTLAPDAKDRAGTPRIMLSAEYTKLVAEDPTVAERWTDGVEVKLNSVGFSNAAIELTEVRAVPPDEMPKQ